MDVTASFHTALFLAVNADAASSAWLIGFARVASTTLPAAFLGAIALALVAGPPGVRRVMLEVIAAMTLAWLAARALQALWPQQRPFVQGLGLAWLPHAPSPSFPSTHATVAAAGAIGLRSLNFPVVARAALLVACLIGWSRVCLGLHFPGDVLAGFAVGAAAAVFTSASFRPMPRRVRLPFLRGRRRLLRTLRSNGSAPGST